MTKNTATASLTDAIAKWQAALAKVTALDVKAFASNGDRQDKAICAAMREAMNALHDAEWAVTKTNAIGSEEKLLKAKFVLQMMIDAKGIGERADHIEVAAMASLIGDMSGETE